MVEKTLRILAINPGSTSTKVGVHENNGSILKSTIYHKSSELEGYASILEQKEMRKALVTKILDEAGIPLASFSAVVGRCGMVKPLESGTYLINEELFNDLKKGEAIRHASALGGIIAYELGKSLSIPAYVVDPVTVDEMFPLARVTGIKGITRKSIFHALNSNYVARRFCKEIFKKYETSRLIVAHLGGGITVSAHLYGKVIDVNNGVAGEGPFTPERAGALPAFAVIDLCFSGEYTKEQLKTLIISKSGMQMYLGTNDLREAEKRIGQGDEEAQLVVEAMAYQVSKQIGAMAAALEGEVDGIILTGGLAHSQKFIGLIEQRVRLLGPVVVYPGEDELKALAEGALAVLLNKEPVKIY